MQPRVQPQGGAASMASGANSWRRFGATPPSAGGRSAAQSSGGQINRATPSMQTGSSPGAGVSRGEQSRANQGDSGWRRFGAPSRGDVQPAAGARAPAKSPERGWRAPADRPQPGASRSSAPDRSGNTQRFQNEPS